MLAALEPQVGAVQQHLRRVADLQVRAGQLEDDAARALGLAEADRHLARVARVDVDALDLVERLDARLGLLGLGRLRAEALDEALHPLDLGLLLADRLAERHLARGGLAAPLRPGAGEEARLAGLELEHGGADRLEEPAVVGDHDDRGVERLELGLQPLERVDVEVVGRLVEQEQVGLGGERAAQRRARELAAGERRQEPVHVRVLEAEVVQHVGRAVAPRVAAAVLELALPARVAVVQRRLGRSGGHLVLHAPQVLLHGDQVLGARGDVVAQGDLALARRALVVQDDPRALLQDDLAAVDRRLAREHAQQRRLARAVAPGDRQPVLALELERHAPQQGLARHVLGEVGCDEDRHEALA